MHERRIERNDSKFAADEDVVEVLGGVAVAAAVVAEVDGDGGVPGVDSIFPSFLSQAS